MNYFYIALASILSAIISSMGMGGGGILMVYFSMFTNVSHSNAQGINLLFFLPLAIISIFIYNKKGLIDKKIAKEFSIFGIIGGTIGAIISYFISNYYLSKMFAIFLLFIGVKELFKKNKSNKS